MCLCWRRVFFGRRRAEQLESGSLEQVLPRGQRLRVVTTQLQLPTLKTSPVGFCQNVTVLLWPTIHGRILICSVLQRRTLSVFGKCPTGVGLQIRLFWQWNSYTLLLVLVFDYSRFSVD